MAFIASCSFENCSEMEIYIIKACKVKGQVYPLSLDLVANVEWSEFFIVAGPAEQEEVSNIIRTTYRRFIPDGERRLIFVNRGSMIIEYASDHCNVEWMYVLNHKGFVEIKKGERLVVYSERAENGRLRHIVKRSSDLDPNK